MMQAEHDSPTQTIVPRRGRGGRPPADQAGDVDRRILESASRLFLQSGFDATSCDQVAAQAGAGKASIYARYANKEALFTAVVGDHVERSLAPSAAIAIEQPLHQRLRTVGISILIHAMQPDAVALMRVVIGTAHRMPDLARHVDRIGRDRGMQRVAEAIAGKASDDAGITERAMALAARFLDLAFVPHQMRALLGDDTAKLEAQAGSRVEDAIALLSHAGMLDDWV